MSAGLRIAARILAAGAGGYGLAAAAALGLPAVLPLPRAEAVLTAAMLSFPLCCGAVIWAFAARSVSRAWLGIMPPALLLACLALTSS
ncbi:DUF3649 domain-containing protein [Dongia sp.]|uniref:DUF3649 domain-containing protein n=1 Tax=Dongia sp. TaxID=1977262 RepID=UPI0035AEE070